MSISTTCEFLVYFFCLLLIIASSVTSEEVNKVEGPKFFLLGAAKAASTSLDELLTKHPQICPGYDPDTKEPLKELQFSKSVNRFQNPKQYQAYFQGCPKKNIAGYIDSTPALHASKIAVANIQDALKNLDKKKAIVIVREPVAREYSHYVMFFDQCLHHMKRSHDKGVSFSESCQNLKYCQRYCDNNKARAAKTIPQLRHAFTKFEGIVEYTTTQSLYYEQIQDFLKVFKRNQIFIVSMDYLINNTTDVTKRLAKFMGLNSDWGNNVVLPRENVGHHYEAFPLRCSSLQFLRQKYKDDNEKFYRFMAQGGGPPSEPRFIPFDDPKDRLSCEMS